MLEVPLLAQANQSLDIVLENKQFNIVIREAIGVMMADVTIDGTVIVSGQRILAGEPIIPYAYLQDGNLVLASLGGEIPFWDQFGLTQTLYYLTDLEMAGG